MLAHHGVYSHAGAHHQALRVTPDLAGGPCAPSKHLAGPLIVACLRGHEGDQLGLLLCQLLLAHHQVALTLSQLALHVRQPLQGLGQLVALLVQHSVAMAAASANIGHVLHRLLLLGILSLHRHTKAVHNVLGSHGNLIGGGGNALAARQAAAACRVGLLVLLSSRCVLQALHQHRTQVLLVQVLIQHRQQLGHLSIDILLSRLVLLLAGPLLEQLAQLGIRDVVGAAAAHQAAPLVTQQLVQLGVDAHRLMGLLLDLREGVHDDGEQEVEQHHEHQQLVAPEEKSTCHALQAAQVAQLVVHVNVTQKDLEAGVDALPKGGELLDGIAKDQVGHHRVAHKHHAGHNGKVDEIRACQPQGAGHHTQAGLEVHELEHACNEQQDVDPVEGEVPVEHVNQVTQVGEGTPRVVHTLAGVGQGKEVGVWLKVCVHVVAQLDVKGLCILCDDDPPHDHTGRQQAVGDEVHNVPGAGEELEEVALLLLGPRDLEEGVEQHAEDPDAQNDLQGKAHVVVIPVVQLNAYSVQLMGHLDRASITEVELHKEVAKDAQWRVVGDELGGEGARVLVQVQTLHQVGVEVLGALLAKVDVKEDREAVRLALQREVVEGIRQVSGIKELRTKWLHVDSLVEHGDVVRGVSQVGTVVVALHDGAVEVILVRVVQGGAALEDGVHTIRLEGDRAGAGLLDLAEL
mmetsp:Transcript_35844/g.79796  ORF Transcript_35844/g.79796 Transcript_35844/m.79796 type:complete len:687 (-) Transcript_35844:2189-4249(-)